MNVTGFNDNENNDSFAGNRSVEQYDVQRQRFDDYATFKTIKSIATIMFYVACSLGIPGNILSAIVWIRRHIASENPSAIYLAALAINDVVYLMSVGVRPIVMHSILAKYNFFRASLVFTIDYTVWLEPLLVLSFSVVRLIAIRRPLQVCCITSRFRSTDWTENSAVVERPRDAQWHFEFFWVKNSWSRQSVKLS